jgi:type IV pilus assembly protein PilE
MKRIFPRHSRSLGFTLVEVVMTLGIVAVLTAIALPSYKATGLKAKRSDGTIALANTLAAQHRFFLSCESYAKGFGQEESCSVGGPALAGKATSPAGLYTLTTGPAVGGFFATAEASGSQAADAGCSTLTFRFVNGELLKEPSACF